jgi:hypothetical protein
VNGKSLIGALLLVVISATPARAHAGARAQLYVASARLEHQPAGWSMQVALADLDSGRPESGFSVQVRGVGAGGSFGPVALADLGGGRYQALLPLADGSWSLTVAAEEIPGGNEALPSTRTWAGVTLHHGQAVELSRRAASNGAGSQTDGKRHLLVLGVAAGLAAVGMIRARTAASRRCRRAREPASHRR